jgi:hypothetical protein
VTLAQRLLTNARSIKAEGYFDAPACMSQENDPKSPAFVLAIEPDSESGAALRHALASHMSAELVIVAGVDDALASIATRIPDLILTSTFLAPRDEATLSEYLRRRADLSHTQVITLPQFMVTDCHEPDRTESGDGVVLRFRPRRTPQITPGCVGTTLRQQVEDYLEQARALRPGSSDDRLRGARPVQLPSDRRRSSRRRATDLAGQWEIRLPAGGDVNIVDISRLGALLETNSKLIPGSLVDLQVLGLERSVSVPARLIRSEIAGVHGHNVRYRIAAAFCCDVDLLAAPAPASAAAAHPPKVLGDLLGRVLADASWVSNGPALCARFEAELGRLVRVREIRICTMPGPPPPGCRTVSFDIPGTGSGRLVLQVIFDQGYEPTPIELRLLEAAASVASVVLELAPGPPRQ